MGEPDRQSGVYLLAGGPGRRLGRDPVLVRAIESSRIEHPSIAYVGAASGDSESFFAMLAAYLVRCGAGRVELVPTVSGRAKIDRTRELLETSDMILVSGGDVEEGMAVLEERGLVPFLRDLHADGKPFFGISAGSIMLARQWIRWEDENDDTTASLFPCLGIAPVNCDTHGEKDGWEELRAMLRLCPEGSVGYGIPSGGAILVRPNGAVEAIGSPASRYALRGGEARDEGDLGPAAR